MLKKGEKVKEREMDKQLCNSQVPLTCCCQFFIEVRLFLRIVKEVCDLTSRTMSIPVSYTHLTLPTICSVQISVVAVSLKKKKKKDKKKQKKKKKKNQEKQTQKKKKKKKKKKINCGDPGNQKKIGVAQEIKQKKKKNNKKKNKKKQKQKKKTQKKKQNDKKDSRHTNNTTKQSQNNNK
eukprot:TRINITY_DN7504_c0_g1_i1.p2 TRINITY_DN7504_c0_g1~~TRINITY_DN7504_c0_g1_i1.p2  ORF type:complete len:179 (-),score=53.57 TRINITY_DN7504_c0_g1_i1:5-541(-)